MKMLWGKLCKGECKTEQERQMWPGEHVTRASWVLRFNEDTSETRCLDASAQSCVCLWYFIILWGLFSGEYILGNSGEGKERAFNKQCYTSQVITPQAKASNDVRNLKTWQIHHLLIHDWEGAGKVFSQQGKASGNGISPVSHWWRSQRGRRMQWMAAVAGPALHGNSVGGNTLTAALWGKLS